MIRFKEAWGEDYLEAGCGAIIKIPVSTILQQKE